MRKSKGTRCAACDQEIKEEEALYPAEVEDAALHFCSPACRTAHKRDAAPSKQELENQTVARPAVKKRAMLNRP